MNGYLLDTNALSEPAKKIPSKGYMTWLETVDEFKLFTSCVALGEIKKGISLSNDPDKRDQFNSWLDQMIKSFGARVITVDTAICLLWGELIATGQRNGKTPPAIDALIAAQCIYGKLVLVTRNSKDFEQFKDLEILSPWSE